jgi:1-phosphofructokinase family hexose kinase
LILTVTINPAIDSNVLGDRLVFEDRGYVLARSETPGGRGINASLVLQSFGVETLALVPSGGETGPRFEAGLRQLNLAFETVPIARSIRTNLILTDRQGLTIKLNDPGPEVTLEESERFEASVRRHLPGSSWLLLCGSLPPGVPASFYSRLIRAAREHGVQTLLDTDGEVLQEGLDERPALITPNQQEAARLLNKGLITRLHFRNAAQRMVDMGAERVILSLGSRGAIAASQGVLAEIVPPNVNAVSPIGAGDALNAVFVWAATRGSDFLDAARWAVAAGTASACLPGTQYANLDQTRAIYDQIEVR